MPARRVRFGATLLLGLLLAACGTAASTSFDPEAPCSADGQRPGAYPELEAALPETFAGQPPVRRDSGRNCSAGALGTLAEHGIDEVRFAGAVWETGRRSGVTIAIFDAEGLTADRLAEFYERGARDARKTNDVRVRRMTVDGVKGHRLDTLNDESFQTIVVFPPAGQALIQAVLVASDVREIETREAHDRVVEEATEAAIGR